MVQPGPRHSSWASPGNCANFGWCYLILGFLAIISWNYRLWHVTFVMYSFLHVLVGHFFFDGLVLFPRLLRRHTASGISSGLMGGVLVFFIVLRAGWIYA